MICASLSASPSVRTLVDDDDVTCSFSLSSSSSLFLFFHSLLSVLFAVEWIKQETQKLSILIVQSSQCAHTIYTDTLSYAHIHR